MSDEGAADPPRRRGGRPPSVKRGKFSFRVTATLRDQLEAASAASGRPVSEEIESRLERSFWQDAIKAQQEEEAARFGADAYLARLEGMCGGPAGLNFAVALGDVLRRLRMKVQVPAKAEVLSLPEDQRRALMLALASVLPAEFGLWDEAAAKAVAELHGLDPEG